MPGWPACDGDWVIGRNRQSRCGLNDHPEGGTVEVMGVAKWIAGLLLLLSS